MRSLRQIDLHPYVGGVFGAKVADEIESVPGGGLLRYADEQTVGWALNFWPESAADDFEWGLGGMKVRHKKSGEFYKIKLGHPVGGELASDVATFCVRDSGLFC
jgi:hypothetical protein